MDALFLALRDRLESERAELADCKVLAAGRDRAIKRRNLLKDAAVYAAALAEFQTKSIAPKANEHVDTHLTKIVTDQFEVERQIAITHHFFESRRSTECGEDGLEAGCSGEGLGGSDSAGPGFHFGGPCGAVAVGDFAAAARRRNAGRS